MIFNYILVFVRHKICNYSAFLLYYPNQFWVAPPRIGPHTDSATLPPWWVGKGLGLVNPLYFLPVRYTYCLQNNMCIV